MSDISLHMLLQMYNWHESNKVKFFAGEAIKATQQMAVKLQDSLANTWKTVKEMGQHFSDTHQDYLEEMGKKLKDVRLLIHNHINWLLVYLEDCKAWVLYTYRKSNLSIIFFLSKAVAW